LYLLIDIIIILRW